MNTPGFLRYFDTTVDELLDRGHEVDLIFTRSDMRAESLDILDETRPGLTVHRESAPRRQDTWAELAEANRAVMDFARYLDPSYADAEFLRNRRRVRVLQLAPLFYPLTIRRSLPAPFVKRLIGALLTAERATPSDPAIERYIQGFSPDVVLVSPLVTGTSPQTDYVKAARVLRIPSGVCVASWDNLTNKGLLRVVPDNVIVWNEAQKREAVELHGARPEQVVVTGAQPFDRWFGRTPSSSREDFCRKVGLDPDRPFVLFTGSTSNIAKEGAEEPWVLQWIEALRASGDPDAAAAGVLVRPHPDRPGKWDPDAIDAHGNAVMWPPVRPNSVTREARTDYFDSLYHATAVVGINTSAMVEAAAIGRPVLTVRAPEFAESQAGTPHFQHLLPENGGFVRSADTLAEHALQLGETLRDPSLQAEVNTRFVNRFIRPHGVDRDCTPILADAIEGLGQTAPHPVEDVPALRPGLHAFGSLMHWRAGRRNPKQVMARWKARSQRVRARAELAPAGPRRTALHLTAQGLLTLGRAQTSVARFSHARAKARGAAAKERGKALTATPATTGRPPAASAVEEMKG